MEGELVTESGDIGYVTLEKSFMHPWPLLPERSNRGFKFNDSNLSFAPVF